MARATRLPRSTSRVQVFKNRSVAGCLLGQAISARRPELPLVVLGLPRGGVAVAHEVAIALAAPLDVLTVRKLGMPGQPELAIGAIATGNVLVLASHGPHYRWDADPLLAPLVEHERRELQRREALYRAGRGPLQLSGQTAVLVDDGLATGCTMLAAIRAARQAGARRILVAAPVASPEALELLGTEAEEIVVLQSPPLASIGVWYEDFEQLSDEQVLRLLRSTGTDTLSSR